MKARVLFTERLELIRLDSHFAKEYYVEWMNDPDVNKYLESGGDYTLPKLKKYLKSVEKSDIYFWAIIISENKKHIGNIKIDPINYKTGEGEYGIMIGDKNSWGKGFAKEASNAVLNECFYHLNLRKVTLGYVESNKNAEKLYRVLNFTTEKILKKHSIKNGVLIDYVRMAICKHEFRD